MILKVLSLSSWWKYHISYMCGFKGTAKLLREVFRVIVYVDSLFSKTHYIQLFLQPIKDHAIRTF